MLVRYFCTILAASGSVVGIGDPAQDVASGLVLLPGHPHPLKPEIAKLEGNQHVGGHAYDLIEIAR